MIEFYENENKQAQKAQGTQPLLDNGQIKTPDYSTKASK
jgi:hypothetical protein